MEINGLVYSITGFIVCFISIYINLIRNSSKMIIPAIAGFGLVVYGILKIREGAVQKHGQALGYAGHPASQRQAYQHQANQNRNAHINPRINQTQGYGSSYAQSHQQSQQQSRVRRDY